jgi:hypothetical protein
LHAGKSTVRFKFAYDGAGVTFAVDEQVKSLNQIKVGDNNK